MGRRIKSRIIEPTVATAVLEIEQIAGEQNREPAEVRRRPCAGVQALERLARNGEKYARAHAIEGKEVPDLVDEVRRENTDRGR